MTCPDCGAAMIDVEYGYDHPEHWDGISEHYCLVCLLRLGRFTGKRLTKGQYEPRSARYELR